MPQVKPVPDGMHTVTPHLVCAGASDAIEFYKKAFNAREEVRLPGPNGRLMHAMIRIAGSAVMLVDEMFWGDRYCKLEDPFGHHWSVATHIRDVTPEETRQPMQRMGG